MSAHLAKDYRLSQRSIILMKITTKNTANFNIYSGIGILALSSVSILFAAPVQKSPVSGGNSNGLVQGRDNDSAIICNAGRIVIRGKNINQVKQSATIKNEESAEIIVDGNAVFKQDFMGGKVAYTSNNAEGAHQNVPKITYSKVEFSGATPKHLENDARIFVAERVFTSDSAAQIKTASDDVIHSKGSTTHDGKINPAYLYGKVRLDGETAQDVSGKGLFREVELANAAGADVRNGGGFEISTKLELTEGQFRNSKEHNFAMGDSSLIVRTVAGSIGHEPVFKGIVSVRYTGEGNIASGEELPSDSKVLKTLTVENNGGLSLKKSVTVNDSLQMASNITTDSASVLTLSSKNNPEFISQDAEVIGSMRRKDLTEDGKKIIFNNQHTYAQFADASARGNVSEMTYKVIPATYPTPNDGQRVRRTMSISASDLNGITVSGGFSMKVGFGWRHTPGEIHDETGSLVTDNIVLQSYRESEWINAGSSNIASVTDKNWGFGEATGVTSIGDFSFGSSIIFALNARVFLEGPYRNGSMARDLRDSNIIPKTPPSIYPYNLDPNRAFIQVAEIPANVIDWVVVEFRSEQTGGQKVFRTCFINNAGQLVGLDGKSSVALPNLKSGSFYIAIRHRTHLAVMTSEPREINPKTIQNIVDFTKGQGVLGGANALKPIGRDDTGSLVFGMPGGDIDGNGKVDEEDYRLAWEARNKGEEYLNADTDMNGQVTTKDGNVSWNNRGKETVVP